MPEPHIGVVIHTNLRDSLFSPEDIRRLEELGRVNWADSPDPIDEDQAVEILRDCQVGIGSWKTPWPSPEVVSACPNLRLWEHVAGTVRKFFGPHLEGRDITIASCKTAIADNVAEMALGEIIIGLRRVIENSTANRCGQGGKPENAIVLSSATVGVVAASQVGRRVIRLLKPFGCKVLLFDPFVAEQEAAEMGVELVLRLVELCRRSDAVSLHTPSTPDTRKIIGRTELEAMKDDAVFVNTSRGACVDEEALIGELSKGRLLAFLDVTEPEPPDEDSPLRALPNCIYTSHIAGPPGRNMGRQAVDDVAAFLSGGSPLCVVTEDQLDHIA